MKDESKNPSSNQNQTITQVEHGDDFQLSLIDPHEPNSFPEENTKISDEDASTQNRHLPETQKSKFEAYMNFIEYFVQPLLDRLFLTFLDFLVVPVAQMCMKLLLFSKTKCEDNQYYSINQSVNSIFDFMFLHQSECTSCSNITTQICLQVCSGHSFYSLKEYEGFRYSTDVIAPSILNFIFGLLISLGIIYYIFRLNQNNIRLIKTLPVIGRLEKFKWYNLLACIESNFLAFLSVFKYKCEDYYIYQIFLRLLFSSVYSFYAEFPRVIVAINFFINIAQIVVLLKLRPYRCFLNFYFELVSYGFSTVITLYSFIYFFFRIPPIIEYIILSCLFLPLLFAFILKLWFKKNMTETPDGELVQTKSVCYKCKYVDKFTSENNINEMKNKDGKKAPLGFCLCRRNLALHNLPDFSVFEGQDPPNYELYDIDFCSNRDPHQKVFPVTTEKFDTSKFQELYQFVERFIESKSIIDIFQFLRGITLLGIVISSWYFGAIYGTHQQRLDLKC